METDDEVTITDPEEAAWVAAQRDVVISYLKSQRVEHAGVSLEPRWFLSPYVAIWAVRSKAAPDRVGWWAISGDLPTDYATCTHERDDADVLMTFSRRWAAAAAKMAVGENLPGWRVGPPGSEREFAPLLLSRAEVLEDFAQRMRADDESAEPT